MIFEPHEGSLHLETLRELTAQLPDFPETIEEGEGFKVHRMACGTSLSWNLLNEDRISAARFFNSSGTIFPVHTHEEREWIIVYTGSMFLHQDGKEEEVRLNSGMFALIEPNTPHSARFLEDCWYLAITIPRAESWPE